MGLVGLTKPEGLAIGQQAHGAEEQIADRFRAAQEDMQAGHCDNAVAGFKEVLRAQPSLVEASVNLGLAYHACGQYELAVSELSGAIKRRPDILAANLFLGLSYLKLGFADKAIVALNRTLTLSPNQTEARRALANAELSLGQYDQATKQFRRLADAQTDKAEAWFALGQDYLEMARHLSSELSTQFPNSAWSMRLAGDILGERALWNDAAMAYRKALQKDAGQAGLHSSLGEALLCAGKTAEAEGEFRAEISRHPFDVSASLGMAEVQLEVSTAHAALEPLDKIWEFSPDLLAQAWPSFPAPGLTVARARQLAAQLAREPSTPPREFLLSALTRVAGDKEGASQEQARFKSQVHSASGARGADLRASRAACDMYQERLCAEYLAAEKSPNFSDRLRLGRGLLSLHQDGPAAEALAVTVVQNRTSPEARYWLDRAYLRLAEECFDELAASYPDSWRAHELKAETSHLRHDDQDALKEYRAAARLNPDNAGIHEALGDLLLRAGQPEEAKSELEAALRINPAASRSLYLLGSFYVSRKEPEKGIPYLEAALRYDPALEEARPVLGKAYLKVGRADLAIAQLDRSTSLDRYGDLHYLLYQAYRQAGKPDLAAQALARSQELRRKSEEDDQAKIGFSSQEQ
jgi:tetratricopeptide (TPR) repeat protein